MSFPFDEKLKTFMAKLGGNRAARRAARRRQRLIEKSNPGYKLEALEPRILLSADPFTVAASTVTMTSSAVTNVKIRAASADSFHITVQAEGFDDKDDTVTFADPNNRILTIYGTDADDNFKIEWLPPATGASHVNLAGFQLVVNGMGGMDHVTITGAGWATNFTEGALKVDAEKITLESALGTIGAEVAGVELLAQIDPASPSVIGASGANVRNVELHLTDQAGIVSSGSVTAHAITRSTLTASGTDTLDSAVAMEALIRIDAGVIISAQTVSISALSDLDLTASLSPTGVTGDLDLALTQKAQIQLAPAVKIETFAAGSDSLRLAADVKTRVDAKIVPPKISFSGLLGLDAFSANLNLTRHADILIGDPEQSYTLNLAATDFTSAAWMQVDLPAHDFLSSDTSASLKIGDVVRVADTHSQGDLSNKTYVFLGEAPATEFISAGDVDFAARISDRPGAETGTKLAVDSELFGVARLTTEDRSKIAAQNIILKARDKARDVAFSALADARHEVTAQFSEIRSRGDVFVDIAGVRGSSGQDLERDLVVSAIDRAAFTSQSRLFDLNDLTVAAEPSVIFDIDVFGAINALERNVRASVHGGDVVAHNINLLALADQRIEALVQAQASVSAGAAAVFAPLPGQASAASYAINRLSGGVSATIRGAALTASAVGVDARNTALIDARVQAGAATTGGSGGAAAIVVALNVLGYSAAPAEALAHTFTDMQDDVPLAEGHVVKTSDNRYYRAFAQVWRSRAWPARAQSIAGFLQGRGVDLIAQRWSDIPDFGAVRAFAVCAQSLTRIKLQIPDLAITREHSLRGRHVISI